MSNNEVRLTPARFDEFQCHEMMLGQIAEEVEEFCEDDETTTYEAVLAMKAELLQLRADALSEKAESIRSLLRTKAARRNKTKAAQ